MIIIFLISVIVAFIKWAIDKVKTAKKNKVKIIQPVSPVENPNVKEAKKMGKMKKALMIIAMIAIIVIAGSVLYYYVFKPDLQQKTAKVPTGNTTALAVATVADYQTRLAEYITFYGKCYNLRSKYNDIIKSPNESFNNSKTVDEQISYARKLLDIYQKCHKELVGIKAPNCAKEAYNYFLESINQEGIAMSCVFDSDVSGHDEAIGKAITEDTKFINEMKRISEDFNKEAEELGLQKPFPNL